MPRLDSEGDVILRITTVEWGQVPMMSNTPKYLALRGASSLGPREVLISESAARELLARLSELFPTSNS